MKKLSLNGKFSIVLGVFVFACVAIAGDAILNLKRINEQLHQITSVSNKRAYAGLELRGLLRLMVIQEKNVIGLGTDDPVASKKAATEIDSLSERFQKLMNEFQEYVSDFSKPRLAKIRSDYEDWTRLNKKIRELVSQGNSKESAQLSFTIGRDLRLDFEKNFAEMIEFNQKVADEEAIQATELYKSCRLTLLALSLVAITLGLAFAWVVLRALGRSIDMITSKLSESSTELAGASQEVASASQELSQSTIEQSAALQETTSSIEEISSMVAKTSENAKRSTDSSKRGQESAQRGKESVEQMIQAINQISTCNNSIREQTQSDTEKLTEIVKLINEIGNKTKIINDIVFQTKLLSFNASVEAARAGEHGKGFAVVAEEVGNLAQMSGNAAQEISSLLAGSVRKVEAIASETKVKVDQLMADAASKVEHGNQVAERCGQVLDEILQSVSEASALAGEISTANQEQASGIQEINRAMSQLDQVTQQNSASSEQAARAAEQLSTQSHALQDVVGTLVETVRGARGPKIHDGQAKIIPFPSAGASMRRAN